jgi:uncharacterized protein YeaO (DUF488 family)
MSRPPALQVRRVYDAFEPGDGYRVLVDRLWPRGLKKADAHIDEWAKEIAPSTDLRRWYGHDPRRFEEFARRYQAELAKAPSADAVDRLAERGRHGTATLLTATRDIERSGATVLLDHLTQRHRGYRPTQ